MLNILTLVTAIAMTAGTGAIGTPNCAAADSWSDNATTYLTRIVTSSDAGNASLRQAFQLPFVTVTPAVEHVTDEAECDRTATALESMYADSVSRRPLWVFRIDTSRFVVADGSPGGRGNLLLHIFDSSYNYLLSVD